MNRAFPLPYALLIGFTLLSLAQIVIPAVLR